MRRLIINADDFGFTVGVNRAIVEAHERGVVTSTTLMAQGPAFDDALESARSAPNLAIGCHVVLIDGTPTLPANQIRSLSNRDQFEASLNRFAWRAIRGQLREDEIEAEATAQIRKLQCAGLRVSHLDTHKHVHMFPQILRPLLRAARTCGIGAIRNPFEPLRFSQVAGYPALWTRYAKLRVLRSLSGKFRQVLRETGISTTDGTVGIAATGALDARLFRSIIESLPEGTWEFVSHPGYDDAELKKARTRLRESRQEELRILTSPETRKVLEEKGVELISYHDLP